MALTIELVEQDGLKDAQEFAQTFGHEIEPCPWPLYMVKKDGEKRAYFYIANPVLIWPALSPRCSARDTKEIVEMVRDRASLAGNPAAVVPKDSKTFTPTIMQKLGFKETDLLLYTL